MDTLNPLSVIKADVGGFIGHSSIHVDLIGEAQDRLEKAQKKISW
jgi:fructose 1,6-bisphosphatase